MPAVVVPVVEPEEPLPLAADLHLSTCFVCVLVNFFAAIILFAAFTPTVLSRHDLVDGSTTTALATLIELSIPKPNVIDKTTATLRRINAPCNLFVSKTLATFEVFRQIHQQPRAVSRRTALQPARISI